MSGVRTVITSRNDADVEHVQELLDSLAETQGLPSGPVIDMHVALDEILSNTLLSGFEDGLPHRIEVTLSVESQTLVAEIEDDCAPFDPLAMPAPELDRSLADRRVGGLGIHFVRQLMSEVTYARVGERNRLVLRKTFIEAKGPSDGLA